MMWLAYARSGKEIEVQEALMALGITAHCAKKVETKRVGKRRRPDVFIDPLLPNYLFIECGDDQYLEAVGVKHIMPTMTMIPRADVASVMRFLEAADTIMQKRLAQIEAGERLNEFTAGDVLDILDGPLSGLTATFKRIVERDRGVFPSIVADIEVMGRVVETRLDVLDVKKAV